LRGLVVHSQSGFLTVRSGDKSLVCRLRGRLKKDTPHGDVVSIGDEVEYRELSHEMGIIEEIYPRRGALVRMAPTSRGEYQQIIIANPDQAVFVFAFRQPEPKLGLLDRMLVMAEKQNIPAIIVVNKIDLIESEPGSPFDFYKNLGYPVHSTSAIRGIGIPELRRQLVGKLSVFAGPSGVGKSTLLNVLIPELSLRTSEVSRATQKGRHATVAKEMFLLPEGGFIADTPGLKTLALWDIDPQELDGYFPEMRELVGLCQFNDCAHLHEPGCAILDALKDQRIFPSRYKSYVRMRLGQDEENEAIDI
jgi:ribosome biogenesis GTPase